MCNQAAITTVCRTCTMRIAYTRMRRQHNTRERGTTAHTFNTAEDFVWICLTSESRVLFWKVAAIVSVIELTTHTMLHAPCRVRVKIFTVLKCGKIIIENNCCRYCSQRFASDIALHTNTQHVHPKRITNHTHKYTQTTGMDTLLSGVC
jgi:hypothetical protein